MLWEDVDPNGDTLTKPPGFATVCVVLDAGKEVSQGMIYDHWKMASGLTKSNFTYGTKIVRYDGKLSFRAQLRNRRTYCYQGEVGWRVC